MKIVKLEIDGFRGIESGKVLLSDFSVLIGANNCGKTTVIESIALLLGRDRLVRSLTEHDFFGSNPEAADRIKIIATISDFSPNDPEHHHEWFRAGRASEKWFDPTSGDLSPTPSAQASKLACQIAFCARFDHLTLEVEAVRYFHDDDGAADPFAEDSAIVQIPISLIKDLGLFLVPANRTWDKMMSFGSELFRRTVAYVGGNPAAAVVAERNRLRAPPQPLEGDERLVDLVSHINSDLKKLFGRDIDLTLRLTTTDSEGVLDSVMPHFAEPGRPNLPGKRHGNGLISFQTLVLLMRFGSLRKEQGDNFIMIVEEPELHIPPPQQRKLLHFLKSMATQTIVTSHSPTVAAVADPHQLILLVNKDGVLSANPLLPEPIDNNATNLRRSLFLSDRSTTVSAVMHPAVLIPEGKLDAGWMRLFCRIADLTESDDEANSVTFTHEVGVIPTKDAAVRETFLELAKVHPFLTCLVDGDAAGNTYRTALCTSNPPCQRIVQWPTGWMIEDIVAWICQADPTVLSHTDIAGLGLPTNVADLAAHLKAPLHKGNEVLHAALADAITAKPACANRVRHILGVLAAITTGRTPPTDSAVNQLHANGTTHIWTFNHAFPRI